MAKLCIGIVGLGWVSTAHAATFLENPDTEIVAVCSRRQWDKQELAAQYGAKARLYNDYEAFLNHPGLEVVDICTPHFQHAEQAVAAARKGKHLLIEKPVALDLKSLEAIRAAVNESRVKTAVYFELRFVPHLRFVRDAITQGLIGEPHHVEVDYYHGIGPWYGQYAWQVKKELGGSALLTAGIHALDSLLMIKDKPVEEVFAYSTRTASEIFKEYEYDSTSVALLKFADGTVGKCVSCVDARQPYLFNVYVVGSKGSIWNDKLWTSKYDGVSSEKWIDIPTAKAESGEVMAHPYGPQVQDFVDNFRAGRDSTVNFETAYRTHRVAMAIEESLAQKRPIKMDQLG